MKINNPLGHIKLRKRPEFMKLEFDPGVRVYFAVMRYFFPFCVFETGLIGVLITECNSPHTAHMGLLSVAVRVFLR